MTRARELGIPFGGEPGPHNAITDVSGVEVGYATLTEGEGELVVGKGPVRTGVTAILPRGKTADPVFAGTHILNGNGEMTGAAWVEESGFLEGAVAITNTHSVGTVRDALIKWSLAQGYAPQPWLLPLVAETYDGFLNDINGFHVRERHVYAALNGAKGGPVAEGNVGGGTGMGLFGFKGGTGTASRHLPGKGGGYTVGVLVQANFGSREDLLVAGVPVGQEITDLLPISPASPPPPGGSIIAVVATDAPLLPHQLKRVARRVPLGIARTGGVAENGSGDLFIAFSTANPRAFAEAEAAGQTAVTALSNERITPLFRATVQATEEAIINALVAAEDMTGQGGNTRFAVPHGRLREVLKRYQRLLE